MQDADGQSSESNPLKRSHTVEHLCDVRSCEVELRFICDDGCDDGCESVSEMHHRFSRSLSSSSDGVSGTTAARACVSNDGQRTVGT